VRRLLSKPWFGPAALALVVALVGFWARQELHSTTERKVGDLLQVVRDANVAGLTTWLTAKEREAALIAADPRVSSLAERLHARSRATAGDEEVLRSSPLQDEFRRLLTRLALDRGAGAGMEGVLGFSLFDTGGRRFAALDPRRIGWRHQVFDTDEATRVLGGEALVLRPMRARRIGTDAADSAHETEMFVAAPVRDERGDVFAVLAIRLRPEAEFTSVLNSSRFGASGESYAFDAEGRMLSSSRFEADLRALGILDGAEGDSTVVNLHVRDPGVDLTRGNEAEGERESWPPTLAVAEASAGRAGVNTAGYRDYRGVEVVGAWAWLPRHGFGLATEIDRAEAFRSQYILQRAFDAIIALLALTALGIFLYARRAERLQGELATAQQLGHYTMEKKIGQGGMGAVYRARHALLRRPTVVKIIRADRVGPEIVKRFEREVQLTSSLTHPNTISIFDYGHTPDGTFYYVMEHLEGLDLDRIVKGDGAQPERRVVHILRQACGSLAEAHSRGIVHRDLKPANLMLCVRGLLFDWVKVLDFGLVKELGGGTGAESITQMGMITGTPLYMAPEMFRAPQSADQRVDLYALGAVAYVLLTGRQPFAGATVADILSKHLNDEPEMPSKVIGVSLNSDLEAFIAECLAKTPEGRPANASAALERLDRIAESVGSWSQAEARAWWETTAPSLQAETEGAVSTGLEELEIDLGGRGTPTRVATAPPSGK
jgi:tRNA A-37 threonylcarbamoyl transferase component Bud32